MCALTCELRNRSELQERKSERRVELGAAEIALGWQRSSPNLVENVAYGTGGEAELHDCESCPVFSSLEGDAPQGFVRACRSDFDLMTKERARPSGPIEGWARLVLLEAGAIRECEEHGWMRDRRSTFPRARLLVAGQDPRQAFLQTRLSPQ